MMLEDEWIYLESCMVGKGVMFGAYDINIKRALLHDRK